VADVCTHILADHINNQPFSITIKSQKDTDAILCIIGIENRFATVVVVDNVVDEFVVDCNRHRHHRSSIEVDVVSIIPDHE
jgi:hypothetical protein